MRIVAIGMKKPATPLKSSMFVTNDGVDRSNSTSGNGYPRGSYGIDISRARTTTRA